MIVKIKQSNNNQNFHIAAHGEKNSPSISTEERAKMLDALIYCLMENLTISDLSYLKNNLTEMLDYSRQLTKKKHMDIPLLMSNKIQAFATSGKDYIDK